MNPNYTIKRLRSFETPDGGGYNVDLYRDGKKVAEIHGGGYGGEPEFHFTGGLNGGESEILDEHCKTLPPWKWEDKEMATTPDIFIMNLIGALEDEKTHKAFDRKIQKATKDHIVFRFAGDVERSFRKVKVPPTGANLERFRGHVAKDGKQIEHVYNTGIV